MGWGAEPLLAIVVSLACQVSALDCPLWLVNHLHHFNAVNRAGRQAKIAACAPISQYRVHVFVGTNNRIDWAGLDAKCATNAVLFVNHGNAQRTWLAAFSIDWQDGFV